MKSEPMLPPLPVTAEDVKRRLDAGEPLVLLDARTPDQWETARTQLKGSLRVIPSEVENHLRFIPQGRPIVTYCESEGAIAATRAAMALVENSWKNVHPLEGGFAAGERAGIATEPRAAGPVNEAA